jgi:chemotaxis signal transduction protein
MTPPVAIPGPANKALPIQAAQAFCTFRLEERLFGLDVRWVKEVAIPPPITSIAHAPNSVRGYVNLRGQIQLVIDLRCLLGMAPTPLHTDTRLVLFKPVLGDPFGVLVDRIGDIVQLRPDQIEDQKPEESGEAREDNFIGGIGKLDGELLILLDTGRLLPCVERSMR